MRVITLLLLLCCLLFTSCAMFGERRKMAGLDLIPEEEAALALTPEEKALLDEYDYEILTSFGPGYGVEESEQYVARIVGVEPLSAAGKAGLPVGGEIVSVDGEKLESVEELVLHIRKKEQVVYEVLFEGEKKKYLIGRAEYKYKAWLPKDKQWSKI